MLPFVDSIQWSPIVSWPLIGLMTAALCFAIGISIFRRAKSSQTDRTTKLLLFLRAAAWVCLLVVVANPTRLVTSTVDEQSHDLPPFYIVLDRSESMSTADVLHPTNPEPFSRFEAAIENWLSEPFWSELSQRVQPQVFVFDRGVQAIPVENVRSMRPAGAVSHIVNNVESILDWPDVENSAGLLLISDGRETSGQSIHNLVAHAQALSVPIHVVSLGSEATQPDIAVRLDADHHTIRRGQSTTLRGEIQQTGFDNQVVDVTLYENGIERQRQRVQMDNTIERISFAIQPKAMETHPALESQQFVDSNSRLAAFRIEVEPLPGERLLENNQQHTFIEIREEIIRVAILENEPYWDTRFLIEALRADMQVEVTTFVGISDRITHINYYPAKGNESPEAGDDPADSIESLDPFGQGIGSPYEIQVPQTAQQLAQYDVIVLGRKLERWFEEGQARELRTYVEQLGGSLVLLRGQPFSLSTELGLRSMAEIQPILPVEFESTDRFDRGGKLVRDWANILNNPVDFQALGDTDVILTQLPGMIAQTRIIKERALSTVWLRGAQNEEPLAAMAYQRAGAGQVLAVLSHGLWQWAMLPDQSTTEEARSAYDLFWARSIRWLAGGPSLLPDESIRMSLDQYLFESSQSVLIHIESRFSQVDWNQVTLRILDSEGNVSTLPIVQTNSDTHQHRARWSPQTEGIHTVLLETEGDRPTSQMLMFAVYDPHVENLDTSADHAMMHQLAERTGGLALSGQNPQQLLDQLAHQTTHQLERHEPQSLWRHVLMLVAILSSLGLEWIIRRRHGEW